MLLPADKAASHRKHGQANYKKDAVCVQSELSRKYGNHSVLAHKAVTAMDYVAR
jgi:hypothetical protein